MTEIPQTMRAMILTGHGGLEKLEMRNDYPVPEVMPGEVLIRVGATGINNTDINTRIGWYSKAVKAGTTAIGGLEGFNEATAGTATWGSSSARFPLIQGADVCGEVVAVGSSTDKHLMGRRIMVDTWLRDWDDPLNLDKTGYFGSETDGGFCEYTKVAARQAHPIDCDLSDVEIATFATSYITAEHMLERAAVGASDRVLITGASGGVGSALIQLAKRRGAEVIAIAGSNKAQELKKVGADFCIDRTAIDYEREINEKNLGPVTVVADVVGGNQWQQLMETLARGGRYTCAGAIASPIVTFDLRTFYLKNLALFGATIVPPGMFANLVGYLERGEIKPLLAGTWSLESLPEAQKAFLEKRHIGNLVIDMRK